MFLACKGAIPIAPYVKFAVAHLAQCASPFDKLMAGLLTPYELRMPARHPTYLKLFARRLNAARQSAGLTQEALGVAAGLDEFVASSRMNHYERAKHWPDYGFACRLAEVLNVPVAYFYAFKDEEAEVLLAFHRAKKVTQDKWLAMAKEQARME